MKKKGFILSMDNPCAESWDKMTPNESGRHCSNCNKTIVDFSLYTDKELIDFISKATGTVCGRLSPYQLNRPIISYEPSNNSLLQKFMLGTALATSFAACNENKTNNSIQTTNQHQIVVGGLEKKSINDSTPKNNYISGRVFDKDDGKPSNKVSVSIKGTGFQGITDASGNFKIIVPDSLLGKKITMTFINENYTVKEVEYSINKLPFKIEISMSNLVCDIPPLTGIVARGPLFGNDSNEVPTTVKNMPKFHGDIYDYIAENIVYPKEMHDEGLEGTVYVGFIIEISGEVSNVRILKGAHAPLDSAAVKVIESMPKWTPGSQNGHKVRVQYTIPIRFQLADGSKGKSSTSSK